MAKDAFQKENKMGTMPVNKLLISMSLPMMLSMLVQALYNIVDSIFVSQLGENALTAVSLAFPMQNLMIAVASGTGVGINALLSRSLGERNFKEANCAANNGILLEGFGFLLFLIFGLLFSRMFFEVQTNINEIVDMGHTYLMICSVMSFGIFGQIAFERLLQSTGKTLYSMFTQGLGAIVNIILDPILIFGWFGLPAMGVGGAAVATVIGQICAMLLGLYFNMSKNKEIKLSLKEMRPRKSTIKRIYAVGVPSIIMLAIGSVMNFMFNKVLLKFTSTAAAVFGVYFKLQSFIFMPVFGLNNGMVPIISYNYGAGKRDRINKTIKLSIIYAMSILIIGFVVFQLFPEMLLDMFNPSAEMLQIGSAALRIISLSFLVAGFCIVAGSVLQSLGKGFFSLIISVARQLIVLLPAAYLLSLTGNLDMVWYSFPIAEVVSLALSVIFMRYISVKIIKPLKPLDFDEIVQKT